MLDREEPLSTPLLSEEEEHWKNRLSLTLAEKEILHSTLFPSKPTLLSINTLSTVHGWFSSLRLFFVRLNRLLVPFARAFLPALFSILGLSYGISFAIDLFIVLKYTFSPLSPSQEEKKLPYKFWKRSWIRFKHIIQEDNRPYRMLNDGIWFTINIVTFCLVGPLYLLLNPILNIIGFGFDTTHEFFWLGRNLQKYTSLIKKLQEELANTNTALNTPINEPQHAALQKDIREMNLTLKELINKRKMITHRQIYTAIFTALIFVGMALLFFPPTSLPGAFLIGSAFVFCTGSLFSGLGRRLYMSGKESLPKLWRAFKKRINPPSLNSKERTPSPLPVQLSVQSETLIQTNLSVRASLSSQSEPTMQINVSPPSESSAQIEPPLQSEPESDLLTLAGFSFQFQNPSPPPSPIPLSFQVPRAELSHHHSTTLIPILRKTDRSPCNQMNNQSPLVRYSVLSSPSTPIQPEKPLYHPSRRRASIPSM
jgi:hypothetical protein